MTDDVLSPEFKDRFLARLRESERKRNTPVACNRCGKEQGVPNVFGAFICWPCHDRSMREPMTR